MFTKNKISQSMIDAVNSVISEEKKRMLLEPELDETGFHKAAHAAKKANQTHFEVGKKVRQTIKDIGGTMPENLPVADSIKRIENKNITQGKK